MSTLTDTTPFIELNVDELRGAATSTLKRSGFTFAELEAQAEAGHFVSLTAQLAWLAVKDLKDLVG